MIPPVILASQSPRRRELLEKTGIPFSIIVRGTEELKEASMPPQELCLHNAAAKAEAVFREHPDSTVIGADTLVFLEGFPLGKPEDEEEARSIAVRLGRWLARPLREQKTRLSLSLITAEDHFESDFGLKAKKRRKLYNGPLACTLYNYY